MSLANFAQPTQWQQRPIQPMSQQRPMPQQLVQRRPAPQVRRPVPQQQVAPPQFNPNEVRRYASAIQALNQMPLDAQMRVIDRIRQAREGR